MTSGRSEAPDQGDDCQMGRPAVTDGHSVDEQQRRPAGGLYVNQGELLERLNISAKAWGRVHHALIKQGFPPQDPLFNKWFWPEIEMFLYRRHGVSDTIVASNEPESEDWNE